MLLEKLLAQTPGCEIPAYCSRLEIQSISCDSRQVLPNSVFVAILGPTANGADFIPEAVRRGASVIVKTKDMPMNVPGEAVCVINVPDTKKFFRDLVRCFYGNPSSQVKTIAVTGTNGKTTITYLLESIFKQAGKRCAVLGTVNHRIGDRTMESKNTTPGLLENQRFLGEMRDEGIEYCTMEVSSHALEQGRVDLIDFVAGIFTNLTGDHLDYHQTMENYFQAKAMLFETLHPGATAIINTDDPYGRRLVNMSRAKMILYGLSPHADVRAENIRLDVEGSEFLFKSPDGWLTLRTNLIGLHNVYNILASSSAALSQGISLEVMAQGIEELRGVPGRLEKIPADGNVHVYVDYAHTPDALNNVLRSLKKVSDARTIVVFGCGGDRDRTKRPLMGRVASDLAELSILTSDNPRSEDPQLIIEEIRRGFLRPHYKIIPDRREAIYEALNLAQPGDVVLIAGKGHETYQIFKDQTIAFDDRQVVQSYFACLD